MEKEEQYMEPIAEKDDLGQVTGEQQLEEYENDVKAYTKVLEDNEKELKNYLEQYEVDSQLWEILKQPNSIRSINPTKEYENNPKWWDLMHKKQLFQIRHDEAVAEGSIKGMNHKIDQTRIALKRAKEKLSGFKKDNVEMIARMKRNKKE